MAEVTWIKITTTMFDDEKIRIIESMPEADAILVIWIKLLALAGKCNRGGFIYLSEDIPYTEEMLATIFTRPLNTVRLALQTFTQFGMICRVTSAKVTGHIYVTNWEKHQNVEGMDKIREQNRIRKQRQRQNQRELQPGVTSRDSHGTVTQQNKNKNKNKNIIMSPELEEFTAVLEKVENYPLDMEKDQQMFASLTERFPALDLIGAVSAWTINKLDDPLVKKSNPRSQIANWCANAQKWGKNQKGSQLVSRQPESKDNFVDIQTLRETRGW